MASIRSLKGGVVIEAVEVGNVPILIVRVGEREYQVEAWRDAEGNGAGHLMVEELAPIPRKGRTVR